MRPVYPPYVKDEAVGDKANKSGSSKGSNSVSGGIDECPSNSDTVVSDDNESDCITPSLSSSTSTSPNNKDLTEFEKSVLLPPHPTAIYNRRIAFNSDVVVTPIPGHASYSQRVRERIWTSGTELYENAARNSYEFSAEGWKWETVTEDEEMIIDPSSGIKVHPCHYQTNEDNDNDGGAEKGRASHWHQRKNRHPSRGGGLPLRLHGT